MLFAMTADATASLLHIADVQTEEPDNFQKRAGKKTI